jgi:predicted DNA-binding transcriptional regulator YafY
VYVDGNFVEKARTIRIVGVLMERRETRLDAVDLDNNEQRHFRLDRITQAEVVRLDTSDSASPKKKR